MTDTTTVAAMTEDEIAAMRDTVAAAYEAAAALTPAMIVDEREKHRPTRATTLSYETCDDCWGEEWPCDKAVYLDALDAAQRRIAELAQERNEWRDRAIIWVLGSDFDRFDAHRPDWLTEPEVRAYWERQALTAPHDAAERGA